MLKLFVLCFYPIRDQCLLAVSARMIGLRGTILSGHDYIGDTYCGLGLSIFFFQPLPYLPDSAWREIPGCGQG